jgi:lipoyl(octanoyl) transferase
MTKWPLEMTKRLFGTLEVCQDQAARSAAMNMAIDEALLEYATEPIIRFYRWKSSALSFGYFGRFADVASYQGERDLVRRWTGGGIVFHGTDLTYSIAIPASDAAFDTSSMSIYEKVHGALVDVLTASGQHAELSTVAAVCDRRESRRGDLQIAQRRTRDRRSLDSDCFANPVLADVMINGRKVAGAAQRRTRRGLLQQGSIQGIELGGNLTEQFAQGLSANYRERKVDEEILKLAQELVERKYGPEAWLRKR